MCGSDNLKLSRGGAAGKTFPVEEFDTTHSKQLYDRACQRLATGVSSVFRRNVTPVPLYFKSADGPYYLDVDGHRLLDYSLAWGPLIVGNNHPKINEAVSAQLSRGYAFGAQHELEIELAERITGIVPGVEQVIFSNTGTEAVQATLRIARAHTGRNKIVKFEGHYHGWANNVLISCHPTGDDPTRAEPTCGGQPENEFADTLVLPWNDLDALEKLLIGRGNEIACVITEPLLANSGSCEPHEGYLAGLIELCRQHGVVSIFDEVITGFRLALGGAREYFGLTPDLSIYAKAMAGGFVLAGVGGTASMFDVLRDGRTTHAGTYNGNPINLTAALATLDILSQPGTYERMDQHGRGLINAIKRAAKTHGVKLAISGVGTVFSVHWNQETPPRDYRQTLASDMESYTRFRAEMLKREVQLIPDARWYVSAVHGPKELELATRAIEQSMAVVGTSAEG